MNIEEPSREPLRRFKRVYQTKFALGKGDCLNAAVASVLCRELNEIPDFAAAGDSGWFERLYEWGKSQGIGVMCLTPPISDNVLVPDGYCIFIHEVVGVKEENHAVVGEIRRVASEEKAWEWEAVEVHDPARGRHKLGKLEHIILLIPSALEAYAASRTSGVQAKRPNCDYTGRPSLDPSQICRCGTCQLFVRILFASRAPSPSLEVEQLSEVLRELVDAVIHILEALRLPAPPSQIEPGSTEIAK